MLQLLVHLLLYTFMSYIICPDLIWVSYVKIVYVIV